MICKIALAIFLLAGVGVQSQGTFDPATFRDPQARLEEFNKGVVIAFYKELFEDKDIESIQRHLSDKYIQHNPHLADGKQALYESAKTWFPDPSQKTPFDFKNIGADGDLVWVHVNATDFGLGKNAVMDLYKVQCGKIVEHWDTIQDWTKPEVPANPHPYFSKP